MPAMHTTVPTLALIPSLDGQKPNSRIPAEREINRSMLIQVAPDREDLFKSTANIEEIRQSLKLRFGSSQTHWLHLTQSIQDVKVGEHISKRFSTFGGAMTSSSNSKNSEENATKRCTAKGVRRRVLSASALDVPQSSCSSLAAQMEATGIPNLSTLDKLISPRQLGPTHILVVYASQPTKNTYSRAQKRDGLNTFRDTRCRTMVAPTLPEVLEVPINDLLFLVNVPNLIPNGSFGDLAILPPRLQNELPKVLLHVPHLETFPELMVYLHTKNQAALFRSIITEWVRDLIHPLPQSPQAMNIMSDLDTTTSSCGLVSMETSKAKRIFGRLVPDLGRGHRPPKDACESARSFYTVAAEIAEAALQLDLGDREDPLLSTAAKLTALRDNLVVLGHYNKELWHELIESRNIVLQALSYRAKVGDLQKTNV
ncbi:hypothetical protein JR316_0012848 [Psilocybe cubensis]|uniref:Uncharacterized protein n=2 Tax=Psilocybe cubensis TaxID=181762 RepID=A0ACB8GG30_PSICU|nr:hypothetical protein JR316_0012848 [Psilocybe cubensis]KAH9474390.1 hypothetical protein JR316_0012848 [Psilocybe cubensis]